MSNSAFLEKQFQSKGCKHKQKLLLSSGSSLTFTDGRQIVVGKHDQKQI